MQKDLSYPGLRAYISATTPAAAIAAMAQAQSGGEVDDFEIRFTLAGQAKRGALLPALKASSIRDPFVVRCEALLDPSMDEWAQLIRFEAARVTLGLLSEWHGHYASALKIHMEPRVKTAGVNAELDLFVAPDFINKGAFGELVSLFRHETEHVSFRHVSRSENVLHRFRRISKELHRSLANWAGDLEILSRIASSDFPDVLDDRGFSTLHVKNGAFVFADDAPLPNGRFIPAGTTIPLTNTFFELLADQLSQAVQELPPQQQPQGGAGNGSPGGAGATGNAGGQGDGETEDSGDLSQSAENSGPLQGGFFPSETQAQRDSFDVRVAIIQERAREAAARREQAGKSRGTGEGGETESFQAPEAQVPMSRFISRIVGMSSAINGTLPDYRRPKAHCFTSGYFEPRYTKRKNAVAWAWDTSGSITDKELGFQLNLLRNYQLQNLFSENYLMLWHQSVYSMSKLSRRDLREGLSVQSGGTTLSCVAEYMSKNKALMPRVSMTVIITDGEVEPNFKLPVGRVIICCTSLNGTKNLRAKVRPGTLVVWVDVNA